MFPKIELRYSKILVNEQRFKLGLRSLYSHEERYFSILTEKKSLKTKLVDDKSFTKIWSTISFNPAQLIVVFKKNSY